MVRVRVSVRVRVRSGGEVSGGPPSRGWCGFRLGLVVRVRVRVSF